MPLKLIKLRKICLDSIFNYSKFLLPIYSEQQFSLNPPFEYDNPYTETIGEEVSVNPVTTKYFFIPQLNKEIFLMGVMHNNQESAIEVNQFLEQYTPDSIVLEIDDNRFQLLQKNYSKYKPEKVLPTLKKRNNRNSLRLTFKKRLEYIIALEKMKEIKQKKCELVMGDVDLNDFVNSLRFAQNNCKCSRSLKDIFTQLWRLTHFAGILTSLYLKQFIFNRVPIQKSLIWNLGRLSINKEDCIVNKLHYQRDFHIFQNIALKAYGNRIFVIVGLLHLKNLAKFLTLYQEAHEKLNLQEDDSTEPHQFSSVDDALAKIQEQDEKLNKILDYVNFNKNKVYCADHATSS